MAPKPLAVIHCSISDGLRVQDESQPRKLAVVVGPPAIDGPAGPYYLKEAACLKELPKPEQFAVSRSPECPEAL